IYYFEPTDELKKYFDSIEFEKEILKKSFYNQIEGMIEGITKEDIAKHFQESKDKGIAKFKNAFNK
ncbi:MAG TPA: hypothetical protein VIV55_02130, partial [Flavobacterium sp.]